MKNITVEFFASTTGEDQINYFSGNVQETMKAFEGSARQLAPGVYRIVDGELCQIISGLSPKEVRDSLDAVSKRAL